MSIATAEPPITLDERPVRTLGLTDQLALWANLGVSLLLPVAVVFMTGMDEDGAPRPIGAGGMSILAALIAIVVGTAIGNVLLGLSAIPGAETGAPAMVLFRGLFGRYGSYAPTILNLAQLIGWATFEIVVIAEAADHVVAGDVRWPFVVVAGVVATFMAIRPIAVVQVLKRYVVWLAILSTIYLFIELLRSDLPGLTDGNWTGFWTGTDLIAALSVSWMPLAADYSRQSRSGGDAFWGATLGYAGTSAAFFALGVFAVAAYGGDDVIASLVALPAGALALAILAVDEVDEAFANIYSTAVSTQNIAPRADRRVLAVAIGLLSTALALAIDMHEYEAFLLLIGSVFVPLFAVFLTEYYVVRRRTWNVSEDAPTRPLLLLPWLAGFATYQLVAPTYIGKWQGWQTWWFARQDDLGFTPPSWMGATIASFIVAAGLAYVIGRLTRTRSQRLASSGSPTA
jgi:putative hydroxymethylpyrimidine transporter CytX